MISRRDLPCSSLVRDGRHDARRRSPAAASIVEARQMDAIIREKQAYHEQTTRRMHEHFLLPNWSARQKLALACRILAAEGHDSGLAGQATTRGERAGTYYMLRFGLGFDEIDAENLL